MRSGCDMVCVLMRKGRNRDSGIVVLREGVVGREEGRSLSCSHNGRA